MIDISRSQKTITTSRKFENIFDVISYVGGIFPGLFAAFFFMKLFGLHVYEMTFATIQFHC